MMNDWSTDDIHHGTPVVADGIALTTTSRPAVVVTGRWRTRADSIPEDRETNTALLTSNIVSVVNPSTTTSSSVVTDAFPPPSTAVISTTPMEVLLMRHSSPLILPSGRAATSPLTERNVSPSPLRLNRPRSNPRNRTPIRVQDNDNVGDDVREVVLSAVSTPSHEPRRIVQREAVITGGRQNSNTTTTIIRPTAGMAIGTTLPGSRGGNRHESTRTTTARDVAPSGGGTRSRKQGPSHRKVRRWNNDNFVNLASEISAGRGGNGGAAAAALLYGSAHTSQYRSILDTHQHQSRVMTQFRDDESLDNIRQQFFDGELPNRLYPTIQSMNNSHPPSRTRRIVDLTSMTQHTDRFYKIDVRLRRILVKACTNSYAATKMVNVFEKFVLQTHGTASTTSHHDIDGRTDDSNNNSDNKFRHQEQQQWDDILLEAPKTVMITTPILPSRKQNDKDGTNNDHDDVITGTTAVPMTTFLFDGDSSTGGFHRLLLCGICQFYCLRTSTSTIMVEDDTAQGKMTKEKKKKVRVMIATGSIVTTTTTNRPTLSRSNDVVSLSEFISSREQKNNDPSSLFSTNEVSSLVGKMSSLKV